MLSVSRRSLLWAGSGTIAAGLAPDPAHAASGAVRTVSAAQFGTVGDGRADDTAALQRALDSVFVGENPGILIIPPGVYKVRRTLKVHFDHHMGHRSGIIAHGARLMSSIDDGSNVFEATSSGIVRFFLIEGLDIEGNGREGHGIVLRVESADYAIYNFCLRDVIVQECGGDGCYMVGNVFEGQIINSYFRKNRGNGATFSHGTRA